MAAPRAGPRAHDLPPEVVALLLASLAFLAIFLSLEPLLSFGAWGSDSGEYATLTQGLLLHRTFTLQGYMGWGFAYPYFPGTFEVGAAVAAATGADPLLALEIAIPVLGALGVFPCFLLFRRLFPSDGIALLGAALTAVASPRLLVLSHAAPVTLGDLLWLASLWALVEQRRDPRWWALMALTAPALVITHHLSAYFFLVSSVGLVVGLEVYAPGRWTKRFPLREFVFLAAFAVGLLGFWFIYAPPFSRILAQGLLGASPAIAPIGAVFGVVLLSVVVHLRRSWARSGRFRRPLWSLRWPSRSHVLRDVILLGALVFGLLSALAVVPLPGTQDLITPTILLWFTPMVLFIPLAAGAKGVLPVSRLGPGAYALLIAVGLSAIFAIVTQNPAIPLDRHPEYMIPPLALVVAIVLGRGLASVRALPNPRAFALALTGVGLLLAASAATAYPPPVALEGFQEGFTYADVSEVSWMALSLPAGSHLASDHRLSDLYFYESGGSPATWDNASCLFVGTNGYCAYAELHSTYLPNPPPHGPPAGPVDAIAVDQTMRVSGVALDPSVTAQPMSGPALARLGGVGFVELYSSGGQTVWWVVLSTVPPP